MKKLILFALLLGAIQPLLPGYSLGGPAQGQSSATTEDGCVLPDPAGVEITSIGTNFISLKWDAVQGAAFYRLRTYDANTDTLVSSLLVVAQPSNNSGTADNLAPGVSYSFTVTPVCSNGYESR